MRTGTGRPPRPPLPTRLFPARRALATLDPHRAHGRAGMRFVCDAAGGKAWFRIETAAEAAKESELMRHAVEKHFRRAHEQASQSYKAGAGALRRAGHRARGAHPPGHAGVPDAARRGGHRARHRHAPAAAGRAGRAGGLQSHGCRPRERRPLPGARGAIRALGRHFGLSLDRIRCYPYGRV
jgi:hypothetical protein